MDMQQMVDEQQARSAREAELSEVLASYADPRAISYGFVVAFVLLGLLVSVLVALAGARAPRSKPLRFEATMPTSFERGVAAYERGDWDDALRSMREAERTMRPPPARLTDYIERLTLMHRDGERLAKAEEALDADEPERALVLAALVAPNSPLFAQAEGLGRQARARIELDMRTEAVLRDEPSQEPVVIDPEPQPAASSTSSKGRARHGAGRARVRRTPPTRPTEPSYEGEW